MILIPVNIFQADCPEDDDNAMVILKSGLVDILGAHKVLGQMDTKCKFNFQTTYQHHSTNKIWLLFTLFYIFCYFH